MALKKVRGCMRTRAVHRAKLRRRSARKASKSKMFEYPPMLDYLRRRIQGGGYPQFRSGDHEFVIDFPRVFSFIDNLDASLECINSLLRLPRLPKKRKVLFDQSRVKQLGLAANAVFSACARLLRGFRFGPQRGYDMRGLFPTDERVRNLVKVMGITCHLDVYGTKAPVDFENSIRHFKLKRGKRGGHEQEITASSLAIHLECCFQDAGYQVDEDFMRHIVKWAGEIMTNAEEHSGKGHWYAMSYMAPIETKVDDAFVGECELVIFNFGRTIFERLQEDCPSHLRRDIEELVASHMKSGFFRSPKYQHSDLWTLFALQDGVSSRKVKGTSDGGRGTVEIIEAFQALGKTYEKKEPKMVLLSGSTRIVFNEKYRMKLQAVGDGQRHQIAFNSSNSLDEQPDSDNVGNIKAFFPGTLLALRFYVDSRYLKEYSTSNGDAATTPDH